MTATADPRAAAIGRRVLAYVIDGAVAVGVFLVPALALGGIAAANAPRLDAAAGALLVLAANGAVLLVLLAWGLVYTLMQGGAGSIGQRAVKIRLADAETGAAIGFWRALLRNVIWGLAGSIVVGYFTPLFDSSGRRQGWHDLVARAVVVDRTAEVSAPPPAPAAPVANPYLPPPAGAVVPAGAAAPGTSSFGSAPAGAAPSAAAPPPAPSTGFAPPPRPSAASGVMPPVASSGMISSVPGVSAPQAVAEAVAAPAVPGAVPAAPAAPSAAPVPPASPFSPPATPADDVDETRAAPSPVAVLTWDDGTRVAVYGTTLFGRNPAAEDGATVVAVRDETLSLSKTHFAITGGPDGAWVVDRHSTNGTTLVRDGGRTELVAGERTALRAGDRLEFGDRRATIGSTS